MGTMLFLSTRGKENASPFLHPKMKQIIIGPDVLMLPGTWEAGMRGISGGKRVAGTDCGGSVKGKLGKVAFTSVFKRVVVPGAFLWTKIAM